MLESLVLSAPGLGRVGYILDNLKIKLVPLTESRGLTLENQLKLQQK